MEVKHNFAMFEFKETKKVVIVESFDNYNFEVFYGPITAKLKYLGTIQTAETFELNWQLTQLIEAEQNVLLNM